MPSFHNIKHNSVDSSMGAGGVWRSNDITGVNGGSIFHADFESGTLAAQIDAGTEAFSDTISVYSDEYVINGTQSARGKCAALSDGFGSWGHILLTADMGVSDFAVGDEVWVSQNIRFKENFNFTTVGGGLKILRFLVAGTGAGSHIDLYSNTSGVDAGTFSWRSEIHNGVNNSTDQDARINFDNQNQRTDLNNTTAFARGVNHNLEVYVKFGGGGSGVVRVWLDNVLLYEDTQNATTNDADNTCDRVMLFTYWNGTAPATDKDGAAVTEQVCYYDDVIIFSTVDGNLPPSRTDSEDNAYIGAAQ